MKTLNVYLLVSAFTLMTVIPSMAQCYMDRHSTDGKDSWISDTTAPSPNANRADGHFIMYDLGYVYALKKMHIWNSNVPDSTDRGVQDIAVDISLDGTTWTPIGEYVVKEAIGSTFYEGQDLVNFGGADVRYVLITALTNYGSPDMYSISEVRFEIEQSVVPVDLLSFDVECIGSGQVEVSWKTENELNNDHYEIEGSADGLDWNLLQVVSPSNSISNQHNYQLQLDVVSRGKNYFRLTQEDRNGKRTTYMTKVVDCYNAADDVTLFPIPAKDKIDLTIHADEVGLRMVHLHNAVGQQLDRFTLSSNTTHTIDITPYPSGQYLLIIENGLSTIEKKFIIVE